jgi:hypothetical protein
MAYLKRTKVKGKTYLYIFDRIEGVETLIDYFGREDNLSEQEIRDFLKKYNIKYDMYYGGEKDVV